MCCFGKREGTHSISTRAIGNFLKMINGGWHIVEFKIKKMKMKNRIDVELKVEKQKGDR
jgi:hypothetical protein